MKLLIFLLFFPTIFYSQKSYQYYYGYNSQVVDCYLKLDGANSEIDYFYTIGKDSLGIEKTRKLSIVSTRELKFILKSDGDSIRVFKRKKNLIVKRKGYKNLKLKPIDKTEEELNDLRDWIRTKQFIQ